MNKVYLSGDVYDLPRLFQRPGAEPHLVFLLQVRHRSKAGVRRELYRISTWNQCAVFCSAHLKQGMRVALQGHLAQRPIPMGDKTFAAVEVAANEIFLPVPSAQWPDTAEAPGAKDSPKGI